MKQYFLIIGALIFSVKVFAVEYEPDLCKEHENALFSCAINDKVVSVCSSKLSYPGYWYLSYRFGRLGDKPELEYNSTAKDFDKKFTYRHSKYAKGYTNELSFIIGSYTYTLHEDSHVFRNDSAGVDISKDDNFVRYFACNNPRPRKKGSRFISLTLLMKEGFPVEKPTYIGTEEL